MRRQPIAVIDRGNIPSSGRAGRSPASREGFTTTNSSALIKAGDSGAGGYRKLWMVGDESLLPAAIYGEDKPPALESLQW
jgi:hypothetical protein